jgi:hypothetical protein
MKEFKISLKDYDFFLKLEVFPSQKLMLEGAGLYASRHNGDKNVGYADAVFFGLPRNLQKESYNKEKYIFERELGKMFFCKEYLDYATIAHECFHASFEFFRQNVGFVGSFSTNTSYSDQNEEFLDCIFTDIYNESLNILTKYKYKLKIDIINN